MQICFQAMNALAAESHADEALALYANATRPPIEDVPEIAKLLSLPGYKALIHHCNVSHRAEVAMSLLEDLGAAGYALDGDVYDDVINIFGHKRRVADAASALLRMFSDGFKPSYDTLRRLAAACVENRDANSLDTVLSVFRDVHGPVEKNALLLGKLVKTSLQVSGTARRCLPFFPSILPQTDLMTISSNRIATVFSQLDPPFEACALKFGEKLDTLLVSKSRSGKVAVAAGALPPVGFLFISGLGVGLSCFHTLLVPLFCRK